MTVNTVEVFRTDVSVLALAISSGEGMLELDCVDKTVFRASADGCLAKFLFASPFQCETLCVLAQKFYDAIADARLAMVVPAVSLAV